VVGRPLTRASRPGRRPMILPIPVRGILVRAVLVRAVPIRAVPIRGIPIRGVPVPGILVRPRAVPGG
jgi:hypothetical protein